MRTLEERIRPAAHGDPRVRDAFGAVLIIAVTAILVHSQRVSENRYFADVVGQMFSFYLLPTMAFALALRQGAIDLSVWAVASLGGVVAALALRAGWSPAPAFVAASLTGGAIGVAQGIAVGRLRWPSAIVTALVAAAIILCLRSIFSVRELAVPAGAFDTWLEQIPIIRTRSGGSILISRPLYIRVLAVLVVFVATMFVVSIFARRAGRSGRKDSPTMRSAAMVASLGASGLLAGLGGAIWLIDQGTAPIPLWIVGDLRIIPAALLGGALLFGHRRSLLMLLCLPATVLAATLWRTNVIDLSFYGHSLQMLLLAAMVVTAHLAIANYAMPRANRPKLASGAMVNAVVGLVAFTVSAALSVELLRTITQLAGLATWLIAMGLLTYSYICRHHTPAAADESADATASPPLDGEDTHR